MLVAMLCDVVMAGRPLTVPSAVERERAVGVAAWRRLSIALAWRPEWPIAALVGIAWLLLALLSFQGDATHAAHASSSTPTAGLLMRWLMSWLMSWVLMSFAMMMPATLPAVRHVALNSIDARRARAMTVYVVAYLAVWVLFGLIAFALIEVGRMPLLLALALPPSPMTPPLSAAATSDRVLLAILLAIATAWQLTRIKRRAVGACKRTVPLPPYGLRADRACARFGVMQAWRCIMACWPLMLLMAALPHPHPLLPMLVLTAIVLLEERAPTRDRLIIPIAGLLAAATVAAALAAVASR